MGIFDKLGSIFNSQLDEEEGDLDKPDKETVTAPTFDEKEKKPAPVPAANNVLSFTAYNKDFDSTAPRQYSLSKINTIKPKDFNEARTIANCLRDQIPVIVNFEETDIKEANRIIDFISGTIYAVGGKIKQVSNKVFICAPDNITLSAADDDKKNIGIF